MLSTDFKKWAVLKMKEFFWFRALDDGRKTEPYCLLVLSDVKMAAFIHCFINILSIFKKTI